MNAADTIYGSDNADASHKDTSHVDAATSRSADVLYGATKVNVVKHDAAKADLGAALFGETVSGPAAAIGTLLEEHGVDPEQATAAARSVDAEINRIGANLSTTELVSALSRPLPRSQTEINELKKQSIDRLAGTHGGRAKAEALLRETDGWLRKTAPGVHAALGRSSAGLDTGVLIGLTNAYLKRGRS